MVRSFLPDHPRSRGVYSYSSWARPGLSGSSPLARGLPYPATIIAERNRIIPARAGFTSAAAVVSLIVLGSSPLARGLLLVRRDGPESARIIPARAGFTHNGTITIGDKWDHPRSRGVYPAMKLRDIFAAGSSPLARGLRHLVASVPLRHRIIPARAGFTQPAAAPRPPYSDHPRSRGVYKFMSLDDETLYGSSPLARGLRGHCRGHLFGCRIIPARAGFTCTRRPRNRLRADHPRSRGVYPENEEDGDSYMGSSPLARGLLLGN